MVTVQEAFTRAKEYAREVLGDVEDTLEEVEPDAYSIFSSKDEPELR